MPNDVRNEWGHMFVPEPHDLYPQEFELAAHRDSDVMNKVFEVDREKLLASLKANRETHEKEWKDAVEGWAKEYAEAVNAFDKQVSDWVGSLTGGTGPTPPDAHRERPVPHFSPPCKPQHHLEDYDLMITGLEMSIKPVVELTLAQIDRYQRDNWEWKQSFSATVMNYTKKFGG